jgi:hypothetical protein
MFSLALLPHRKVSIDSKYKVMDGHALPVRGPRFPACGRAYLPQVRSK